MFYCEQCRAKLGWPDSLSRSRGPCEVCGMPSLCYDRPSSSLPAAKAEPPSPRGGKPMITRIKGTCQYEDCTLPATSIACGRREYDQDAGHPEPACYCDVHAAAVASERQPECWVGCPNCGCRFGVN